MIRRQLYGALNNALVHPLAFTYNLAKL